MKLKEKHKEIDALVEQGYNCHYQYPELGLRALSKAISKARKINYDKGLVAALINKARCNLYLGKSKEVMKCCYDILTHYKHKTTSYQKCDIYNLLGVAHNYLNEPFLGLKCAYQGLRCANRAGSFNGASNCHNTIAHIYLNDKIYDKALEHLLECLATEKKTGIISIITRCNAASVLLEMGKFGEAKKFLDEAMAL